MTRFPGLDPEDLATLRAHQREPGATRSRRARNPFADAATVEHVEHWPCRGGCGRMIGVTAEGVEAFAIANAELAVRGERPVAKAQVMWCPDCKRRDDELAQAQRRPHQQQHMAGMGPEKGRR